MAAYGYMDAVMAGLVEGVGDARTTDPVILKAAVGFGKPLFGYQGDSVANAFGYLADTAKISIATDLVTSNSSIVTVNGVASAAVVFASPHAATMTALIAAIKAIPVSTANPYGVEAVLDPADTNGRTILVRTKGVANTTTWAITGGTPPVINASTYASGQVFLGIHRFKHVDTTSHPAVGDCADVVRIGTIWAVANSGPKKYGAGYVASTGVMANSGAAISTVKFASNYQSVNSVGLAKVEVLGSTPMTYGAIAF